MNEGENEDEKRQIEQDKKRPDADFESEKREASGSKNA